MSHLATAFLLLLSLVAGIPGPVPPAAPNTRGTPVSCSSGQLDLAHDALLVTSDGGRLFTPVTGGWRELFAPATFQQATVALDGNIYLYSTQTGQIWRSSDAGATWSAHGQAPVGEQTLWSVLYPSPKPDVLMLVANEGAFYGDVVYRSVDAGITWSAQQKTDAWGPLVFSPSFADEPVVFATRRGYHIALGVVRSADGGLSWEPFDQGLPHGAASQPPLALSPQFSEDGVAFVGGGSMAPGERGLFKTSNGGVTWAKVNEALVGGPTAFSPDYGSDRTLVAPEWQNQRLLLSTDDGQSMQVIWDEPGTSAVAWGMTRPHALAAPLPSVPGIQSHVSLPAIGRAPSGRQAGPVEIWLVARQTVTGQCYLHRSLDLGASWEEITLPE